MLLARLPCSTNSYGSPFHRPKPASQSPRTPSDTLPTYTQLHLLRSFDPSVNPFTSSPSYPELKVAALLDSVPSRDHFQPRSLHPPKPNSGLEHVPRNATPRTNSPQPRVRPPRCEKHRVNLVGSTRPLSRPDRTTFRWHLLLP
jgi:hypothetical protein